MDVAGFFAASGDVSTYIIGKKENLMVKPEATRHTTQTRSSTLLVPARDLLRSISSFPPVRSMPWWRRRMLRVRLRLVLSLSVYFRRFRVWVRRQLARVQFLPWLLITSVIGVSIAVAVVHRHRVQWQKASQALADKGTLSSLEVAIGAAIVGIIGIVFSLSLFSIQQAAQRGTTFTLREYTRDWGFKAAYWVLALFGFLAMLSSLQVSALALYRISISLAMLVFSVVILRVYFDRVMKFVDPHFTISKVAKRARKFLKGVEEIQRAVQSEVRYERARRHR